MLEVDRQQADLPRNGCAWWLPAKSAGNHQVKHEEEFALGFEDDPLAEPMKVDDRAAVDRRQRRVDRAQEKRRRQTDALHLLPDDTRPQRVEVQEDVRQLGHGAMLL